MKVLKKMRYIFGVLLVMPLLFSGTPVVHGFVTTGHSEGAFPLDEYKLLITKVHKPQWKIGYRYGADCKPEERQNGKELEDAMSASLRTWLEPLKELQPGRPIVDRFIYELQPDFDPNQFNQFDRNQPEDLQRIWEILGEEFREIDLRVTFECTPGISFAGIGLLFPPKVVMRVGTKTTPRMLWVLNHEFGHTFGLSDTYARVGVMRSRGGLKWTTGTQPASVMAGYRFGDTPLAIGEDDKRGIVWLYKYYYENLAKDDCFFDDYVSVDYGKGVGGCEPRYPFIFETKHNPPEYALQLLEDDPAIDINAQDVGGMTALHYAVMYEKVEIVQALLAHEDIKPSLKNKQGQIPLDTAHAANHIAIINMFPKNKQDHTPLDVAPGTNLTTTWGAMKQR
ncbi:hypothetical protein F4Y59_14565 [Candidatus Poribacteria bacterium]|nr:hypothetical protein [Candidatus Poribacteria bacterium]